MEPSQLLTTPLLQQDPPLDIKEQWMTTHQQGLLTTAVNTFPNDGTIEDRMHLFIRLSYGMNNLQRITLLQAIKNIPRESLEQTQQLISEHITTLGPQERHTVVYAICHFPNDCLLQQRTLLFMELSQGMDCFSKIQLGLVIRELTLQAFARESQQLREAIEADGMPPLVQMHSKL